MKIIQVIPVFRLAGAEIMCEKACEEWGSHCVS